MEKIIRLDEDDIIQIIANSFNVDQDKVDLKIVTNWEGYGPMEKQVHRARVTIKKRDI